MFRRFSAAIGFVAALAFSTQAWSGSIFLTGHDPDFHAVGAGAGPTGAQHLNQVAINFILDPTFNPIFNSGVNKFLFVESFIAPPPGHRNGVNGIVASGFTAGTDFEHHDATTLDAQLNLLGTKYSGIVVASDFGGVLTSAELDILNARSTDIINFLNSGGGVYAMAESNSNAQLTTGSTLFGFLPFVVSSTQLNQSEAGIVLTSFGASLGLVPTDVNTNFSHNIFNAASGLQVVDVDSQNNIMSLAGRGTIDPNTGIVPVPAALPLLLTALGGLGLVGWRRRNLAAMRDAA